MADIAELGFRVDSSGLVRAANDLERLNRAAASAANNRVRIAADVSGVDAALREIERLAVNRSIRIDANVTGISEALRDLDRLSGGARGVRIDVAISGVEAAVRGLRDIERLAVNRTVRIDIDMGDIGGAIRDLERLAQQARDAAAEINGLGSNVNVTSGAFGNLGGVLSTVLSGGALAVATTAMIEQARQLTVLSNAYDVSTNSIQTWQAAAKPLGIEADKIGDIFKDVSDKIGDFATTGGGEAKDMFEMLGLSIEEFKSLAPDKAILKIGDALDKSDLTKSQKIFLLEGLANDASLLLPLLEDNAAALKKVSDNAAIQSSFMTDADIATMNQASVAFREIQMAAGGVTTQLGLIGAGMLIAFGDDITAAIGGFVSLMQSAATEWAFFVDNLQFSDDTTFVVLREVGAIFASIGDAIAPITPYLTEFGIAFAATGVALAVGSAALSAAGAAFALLTSPITLTVAAIAGLIVAGKALYENWGLVTAKFGELAAWWSGTTFDQKILDIETTALEAAESISTAFFDWWDNSALKPIALEIQAAAIDYAQQAAQAFGAWWDSWTLREVTADVTADLLIWAWEKAQAFGAWWDSWHLTPKEGSVDTSLIEKAWSYVQSFVDWWNSISLKDLASGAMSALNSVKQVGSDIIGGLADGINRATAHIGAAKKAAGAVESTMRKELDTHSPSRVMAAIGGDVVDGLAQGINKNATKAEKAAAKMAENAAKVAAKEVERINGIMGKAATDMTALSIQYNQGASAAEIFRKEQDGMTTAQARATVALEEQADALKDLIKHREAANDAYKKALAALDDEHAKLTLSTEDYQRHKLEIQGVIGAKANEVIARQQVIDKLKAEQKAQKETDQIYKKSANDLLNVFENAIMEGKSLFDGLKSWVQDLFKSLILRPVLQPITNAAMQGMQGAIAGKSNPWEGLKNAGMQTWSGMQAGGMPGAFTAAGAAGGLVGLLGGTQQESIGASIGAGIGNVLLPGLGGVIGGALGGLAGSMFGRKWEATGSGLSLQYGGGDVSGQSYIESTKKGGLFSSTKRKTEYSELESALGQQLDAYFDAVERGIVSQSSDLVKLGLGGGEAAAQAIIDGFESSLQKLELTGKTDAERQTIINDWANGITDQLYSGLLGSETFGALDALAIEGESTADTFARLITQFTTLDAIASNLDLQFNATGTAALTAANSLAGVFGGLQNLTAATDFYYQNFFSEEERKANLLQAANDDLYEWNNTLGLVGDAAIDTQTEMRAYVSSLDLTTEAGQRAYHAAMGYAQAVLTVVGAHEEVEQAAKDAAQAAKDAAAAQLEAAQAAQQQQTEIFNQYWSGIEAVTASYRDDLAELESAYADQKRAYDSALRAATGLRNALLGLSLSDLSTLTPEQKLTEARNQYDTLLSQARGGDVDAAAKLQAAGEELLKFSRDYFASSDPYSADFAAVQAGWESVAGLLESQQDPQQAMLAEQQRLVDSAEREYARLSEIFAGIIGGNDLQRLALAQLSALPAELSGQLSGVLEGLRNVAGTTELSAADDALLAVDAASKLTDGTAQIISLYQSLLGRLPDTDGLKYWVDALQSGFGIDRIAQAMTESIEYRNSHADGLASVPYDGYQATLHEGEAVIDARAMFALRKYGIPAGGQAPVVVNVNTDELAVEIRELRSEVVVLRAEIARYSKSASEQRDAQLHQSESAVTSVARHRRMS